MQWVVLIGLIVMIIAYLYEEGRRRRAERARDQALGSKNRYRSLYKLECEQPIFKTPAARKYELKIKRKLREQGEKP